MSVNGVDLGGLSPDQARTKLRQLDPGRGMRQQRRRRSGSQELPPEPAPRAGVGQRRRDGRRGRLAQPRRQLRHPHLAPAHRRGGQGRPAPDRHLLLARRRQRRRTASQRTVDRPARDASVAPTPTAPAEGPRAAAASRCARAPCAPRSSRRSSSPSEPARRRGPRQDQAEGQRARPRGQKYPTYLTVSKAETKLRFWRKLKLVKAYDVAVGQPAWPTDERAVRDPDQAGRPDLVGAQLLVGRQPGRLR